MKHKFIILLCICCLSNSNTFSQLLLNEDFDYKMGYLTVTGFDNVSNGKWGVASGAQAGSMALNVDTGNLTYNGYYSALNTNKFRYINPWGSDYDRAYTTFAPQYNGTVFCSFLINIKNIDTNSYLAKDYLLTFLGSTFLVRRTGFNNNISINFGVHGRTFDPFTINNISTQITHLIVFAYKFELGTADSNYIWVDPNIDKMPAPDLAIALDYKPDSNIMNHNSILLGGGGYTLFEIDAIHVGKTWKDIMGVGMPSYNIEIINTTNADNGDAEWMGVRAKLHGIVYNKNQAKRGIKFLLRDATGGITIIDTIHNYTNIPTEGDSIEVKGTVFSDRGLVSFALDTLLILSSNHSLKQATLLNKLYENTENDLIRLNKVKFVSNSADSVWRTGYYKTIETYTLDTNTIYINETSTLIGKALPKNTIFSIIGIAGQMSSSITAPFANDGYYVSPRYMADIVEGDSIMHFSLLSPIKNKSITLSGNQNDLLLFNWQKAKSNVLGQEASYTFELDTLGGDFTKPLIHIASQNSAKDTMFSMGYETLSNWLKLKEGQVFSAKWRVLASIQNNLIHSDSAFNISFTRGKFNGIEEITNKIFINAFPNPATESITLQITNTEAEYTVYNSEGIFVSSGKMQSSTEISLANISSGIYFIHIKSLQGDNIGSMKFVKK